MSRRRFSHSIIGDQLRRVIKCGLNNRVLLVASIFVRESIRRGKLERFAIKVCMHIRSFFPEIKTFFINVYSFLFSSPSVLSCFAKCNALKNFQNVIVFLNISCSIVMLTICSLLRVFACAELIFLLENIFLSEHCVCIISKTGNPKSVVSRSYKWDSSIAFYHLSAFRDVRDDFLLLLRFCSIMTFNIANFLTNSRVEKYNGYVFYCGREYLLHYFSNTKSTVNNIFYLFARKHMYVRNFIAATFFLLRRFHLLFKCKSEKISLFSRKQRNVEFIKKKKKQSSAVLKSKNLKTIC